MIALVLAAQLGVSPLTWAVDQVSLVPPEPLPLGGYTARGTHTFEPGGGPLIARCLTLRHGKTTIAMVTCELLTIPESLVREVKAKLPAGVTLWMNATHTHCAPDSQMLNERMTLSVPGIANFRRRWLDWYAAQISESIKRSMARPPVATDSISTTIRTVHQGNAGRRTGAQPDPRATTLSAADGAQLMVSYAAHATLHDESERKLNGDWPGAVLQQIPGLVIPGAIGDVSPRSMGDTADAQAAQLARWLLEPSSRVTNLVDQPVTLATASATITLPKSTPHPTFAKANNVNQALAQIAVNAFAPRTANVIGIRIGSVAILGIPGEPTAEIGRKLLTLGQHLGFRWVIVASHVNGWIGYILMPKDYDRGGYEATLSFHGRNTAIHVIDAGIECLLQLSETSSGPKASRK